MPEEMFGLLEKKTREVREGRCSGRMGRQSQGGVKYGRRHWKRGPRKSQEHISLCRIFLVAGCVVLTWLCRELLAQFYLQGALL